MGSFVLRKGRPRADGRVTVTFSGYIDGKRIYHGTGISVRPEDWDVKKQQVRRTDPNYAQVNATLSKFLARFATEVATIESVDAQQIELVRKGLSRRRTNEKNGPAKLATQSFWSMFAQCLKVKETELAERTIAKYQTLERLLSKFEVGYGNLTFTSMDHDFYDAFKKFLLQKRKLTNNSVGKYISTLKTFLAWAEERGAKLSSHYRKFKVDEEDVEVIALTWDEFQKIASADLTNNTRLERVRDLFVFSCYTGARFGDVQALHPDDVKENTWHLRMRKTKSEIQIHLIQPAIDILKKYMKDGGKMPEISSQRMNDYLKELGKMLCIDEPVKTIRYRGAKRIEDRGPKWEFLSSHVARRSFVTLSLERGMRPETVMSITGHRSFKTMKKYIAMSDARVQHELKQAWETDE